LFSRDQFTNARTPAFYGNKLPGGLYIVGESRGKIMKSTFKVQTIRRIAGIIALIAIVRFSMAACYDGNGAGGTGSGGQTPGGGGSSSNTSLNSARRQGSGNNIVSIVDRDGFFTTIGGGWVTVRDKGNITIGDKMFRNIINTGNRTWSFQVLTYDGSTSALAGWYNGTITLSADGRTFTANVPDTADPIQTFTKVE
jgi:hypothetical protein